MNNSTNFTSISPATYTFNAEMWMQMLGFYVIIGFVSLVCNMIVFILIIKYKKLHTFFYALVAGHSLVRALYSLETFIVGIHRIAATMNVQIMTMTKFQCHTLNLLFWFCAPYSSVTIVLLAADRLMSLGMPMRYRKYPMKRGVWIVIGSAALTVLLKVVSSYWTGEDGFFTKTVFCSTGQVTVSSTWWSYNYISNLFLVFSGVLMYIALYAVAFTRKRAFVMNGTFAVNGETNQVIKASLKLLEVVGLLIIVNVTTVVAGNLLSVVSSYIDKDVSTRLSFYAGCFYAADRLLDPIILVWKSSDVSKSFRSFIGRENSISMLTSASSRNQIGSKTAQ